MSNVRADVYLSGVDELELFIEFERKLKELQQIKYPQTPTAGLATYSNLANAAAQTINRP